MLGSDLSGARVIPPPRMHLSSRGHSIATSSLHCSAASAGLFRCALPRLCFGGRGTSITHPRVYHQEHKAGSKISCKLGDGAEGAVSTVTLQVCDSDASNRRMPPAFSTSIFNRRMDALPRHAHASNRTENWATTHRLASLSSSPSRRQQQPPPRGMSGRYLVTFRPRVSLGTHGG